MKNLTEMLFLACCLTILSSCGYLDIAKIESDEKVAEELVQSASKPEDVKPAEIKK